MESVEKRQPRYWINPNSRIRFTYFSIEWHLCDHQDLMQDHRTDNDFRKSYRTRNTCVIVLVSKDHSKTDILYSEEVDFSNLKLQKWLRENIKDQVIQRASLVLPQRMHELENKHQLFAHGVKVKPLRKGVLGQCTHTNYITLSPIIVIFPQELMDDVILHEMAHLKHHHHRKSFWKFLSELIGGDAQQQKLAQDIALSKYWGFYTFLMK